MLNSTEFMRQSKTDTLFIAPVKPLVYAIYLYILIGGTGINNGFK